MTYRSSLMDWEQLHKHELTTLYVIAVFVYVFAVNYMCNNFSLVNVQDKYNYV